MKKSFASLHIFLSIILFALILSPHVIADMSCDSITPDNYTNNGPVILTLTGQGYQSEPITTIWLLCTGLDRIFCSSLHIDSDSQMTVTFDLTGQAPGSYTLVIGTASSGRYYSQDIFTIFFPYRPEVASIEPESGGIDDQPFTCTVRGRNFYNTPGVWLVDQSGSPFPAVVSYISHQELIVTWTPGHITGHRYQVQVENLDGQVSDEEVFFTVYGRPPVVQSVNPVSGEITDETIELEIFGTEFQNGCMIHLVNRETMISQPNKTPTSIMGEGTGVTGGFDLSELPAGEYQVIIENPDSQRSTEMVLFQVTKRIVPQYQVIIAPGPGGCTHPYGSVSVREAASLPITITPDTGYRVKNVYLDGIPQGPVTSLVLSDIRSHHEIFIEFSQNEPKPNPTLTPSPEPGFYYINASADYGSSIEPSGNITVSKGSDISFRIYANPGFHLIDLIVDARSAGVRSSWNFSDVRTDHTIQACSERNISPTWAYFEPMEGYGESPFEVVFISQDLPDVISEFWSYGDGITAYGKGLSHTYQSPGQYPVHHQVVFPNSSSQCFREVIVAAPE